MGNNGGRGLYIGFGSAAHDIAFIVAYTGTSHTDLAIGSSVVVGAGSDPGGAGTLRLWMSGGCLNLYNDRGAATELDVEYLGPGV